MKNLLKKEWLLLLALAAPFAFLASVWPQIPDRVPIHFNASFTPDGWMHKTAGVLLMPIANVVVVIFTLTWFRFDPKMAKYSAETREQVARVLRQCLIAAALLFSGMSVAIVWAAWGRLEPIQQVMIYGLPVLLMVLGNGMGKLRPNHTIGIRLPWTLESTAVWNRTHRLGGLLLVCAGATLLGLAVLGLDKAMFVFALLGVLGIWAAVVVAYAFSQSRNSAASHNSPAQ